MLIYLICYKPCFRKNFILGAEVSEVAGVTSLDTSIARGMKFTLR